MANLLKKAKIRVGCLRCSGHLRRSPRAHVRTTVSSVPPSSTAVRIDVRAYDIIAFNAIQCRPTKGSCFEPVPAHDLTTFASQPSLSRLTTDSILFRNRWVSEGSYTGRRDGVAEISKRKQSRNRCFRVACRNPRSKRQTRFTKRADKQSESDANNYGYWLRSSAD